MNIILTVLRQVLFFSFVFFRAAPVAYRGSQARGRIGAVAAGLCQSQAGSSEVGLCPAVFHPSLLNYSETAFCPASISLSLFLGLGTYISSSLRFTSGFSH